MYSKINIQYKNRNITLNIYHYITIRYNSNKIRLSKYTIKETIKNKALYKNNK